MQYLDYDIIKAIRGVLYWLEVDKYVALEIIAYNWIHNEGNNHIGLWYRSYY